MIKLIQRGGAGYHTVAALLDYCTVEGNLSGFPDFEPGNNLHSHITNHTQIKTKFYNDTIIHTMTDDIFYTVENGRYIHANNLTPIKYYGEDTTLAPIANNNFGRILILTMGIGKTKNKKLPPDDHQFDYSNCTTLGSKLEKIAFSFRDELIKDFAEFHGHRYPNYPIDVMWFYRNEYQKIIDAIVDCGWEPKPDKVKEFCKLVLTFNQKYYTILDNVIKTYNQVINKEVAQCDLTFYETASILALLEAEYNLDSPDKVKFFETIPTTTKEFFELCH